MTEKPREPVRETPDRHGLLRGSGRTPNELGLEIPTPDFPEWRKRRKT